MKILLHACCGPCSLEPVRILAEQGHELTIDYCNPNIHPEEEYAHRLETLKTWASDEGIDVIESDYDPEVWEREVGRFAADIPNRCRACYRLRFERVAARAVERGFDAISTTLSVSPYQFTDVIEEELVRAADAAGIEHVFYDFRENYPEATRRSRELGMYRQNYCGCHYSDIEAQREREERRAARKAAKEAKRLARDEALRAQATAEAPTGFRKEAGCADE